MEIGVRKQNHALILSTLRWLVGMFSVARGMRRGESFLGSSGSKKCFARSPTNRNIITIGARRRFPHVNERLRVPNLQ